MYLWWIRNNILEVIFFNIGGAAVNNAAITMAVGDTEVLALFTSGELRG